MQDINYKIKNKSGIYSFLNLVNGKRYVGSSVDLYNRLHEHVHNLKNNKAHNAHFQNAWNKYGEDSFRFMIVEVIDDCEIVLTREQYWIDYFEFDNLYNINPRATGGLQFTREVIERRAQTNKSRYVDVVDRYKKWKAGEIKDDDLSLGDLGQFRGWLNCWNKGLKFKSTDHLKVPKRKKGDRTKDILTKRNKLPEIEIYTTSGEYLKTFRSAKDIEDWSITSENDLPIKSRFSEPRMGKDVKLLQSVNINKSCKTGKPYKNLIFKFKATAPNDSDVIPESGELLENP